VRSLLPLKTRICLHLFLQCERKRPIQLDPGFISDKIFEVSGDMCYGILCTSVCLQICMCE
jgi:hypothetical protein